MNGDSFDKLQIDKSVKLAFPGIDIKEIKQSTTLKVGESRRLRTSVDPNGDDKCLDLDPISLSTIDKSQEFVLIVVKLPKVDANKGILPLYVSNDKFMPADADKKFKLEGDGSVAFWKSK